MKRFHKIRHISLFSIMLLLAVSSVIAQSSAQSGSDTLLQKTSVFENKPWPVSRFSARLGGFWAVSNTKLGVGFDDNPYSIVNFENNLGMNRNTASILLNFNARFGKHNRVDLSYYRIYRNTSTILDEEIHFGDHVYPVNSEINAYLNTNILRLSYDYAFISNRRLEIGALVGFHVMGFNTGMDIAAQTQQLSFDDDIKFAVPLPDFGLWGTYAFHRNWAVTTELSYFQLKYNSLEGRILSGNLSLQYRLNKHWEVDLGYTAFDVMANLDRKRLKADFNWGYSGPSACLVYRFNL